MTDYKLLVPFLLKWEGGIANNKDDKGGLTNKGVTYATYTSLCKRVYGVIPTMAHFHSLTDEQIGLIVKWFWDKATFNNSINSQKVAEAITTWHWGSGYLGLKWFQEMIKTDEGDGIIGNNTVILINSFDESVLFRLALKYRLERFGTICKNDASQQKFYHGWVNRLSDFAKRHNETEYFDSLKP